MMKADRDRLRKHAEMLIETNKPYVIGETKPCQHYNMSLSGYCNECNRQIRQERVR